MPPARPTTSSMIAKFTPQPPPSARAHPNCHRLARGPPLCHRQLCSHIDCAKLVISYNRVLRYPAAAERYRPHDGPSPHDAQLPDHASPVNRTSTDAPADCPYAISPACPHCDDASYTGPHDIIRVATCFRLHDTHGDLDRRWTGQEGWRIIRW